MFRENRKTFQSQGSLLTVTVLMTLGALSSIESWPQYPVGSLAGAGDESREADWPMLGGSSDRRMVSATEDLPAPWVNFRFMVGMAARGVSSHLQQPTTQSPAIQIFCRQP